MRSRITWTMVASGVLLIGVGLMHFSLTALQEPGPLETRIANLTKHSAILLASRHGVPPRPLDTKASSELGGAHYGLDCGICHGVDGRLKRHLDSGCTHVRRISPVSKCRAIPISSCFGSSTTGSNSQGCRASANLRRRITFGVWWTTCGHYRVQSRRDSAL